MAQLEAKMYGRVLRVVTKASGDPETTPPTTQLVVEVTASEYPLHDLAGLLSEITIAPRQQVMAGVR